MSKDFIDELRDEALRKIEANIRHLVGEAIDKACEKREMDDAVKAELEKRIADALVSAAATGAPPPMFHLIGENAKPDE